MRLITPEIMEVQEKILKCRKDHGYNSCSQCPVRLQCHLLDELISIKRKIRYSAWRILE